MSEENWTERLRTMSEEERREIRDALDELDKEAWEPPADSKFFGKIEWTSLSLPHVYIDIVPPKSDD